MQNEKEMMEHIVLRDGSRSAGWTVQPPLQICGIHFIEQPVQRDGGKAADQSKEQLRSRKDGPHPAPESTRPSPCFVGIMALVFYLTFGVDRRMACQTCWNWASTV